MSSEPASNRARGGQRGFSFGRGRPVTKRSDWASSNDQQRRPRRQANWDSESSASSQSAESGESVKAEEKIELSEAFEKHRLVIVDLYTAAGAGREAAQQLLQAHPQLADEQLEELAKLAVKATEEGHSHLSLLGQVDPAKVAVALLTAYGAPFRHRLDGLLLRRLQALQSRAERSRTQNFVTGFDERFVEFLGSLAGAAPDAAFRAKAAACLLAAIDSFLRVQLASVDRWRRAVTPMSEFADQLFSPELRAACPEIDERLTAVGRQLALAETDRFMAGHGCTFVRPLLADLLERLRAEGLLPRRQ